ncbi:MAG: type II toxin-antitoxin system VapC family toxin [Coriobacteriales bacterium]|nr:type II toxin-antitoxin system VapC family toxin [Coriobacteriales bacterium]
MAVYADTSFLLSAISTESSSDRARTELDRVIASEEQIQTSVITKIEMARAIANRGIDPKVSTFINRQLTFIDIDETIIHGAIELEIPQTASFLRTLDAIHIATARQLAVKTVLTFDNRQRAACQSIGLDVSPLD